MFQCFISYGGATGHFTKCSFGVSHSLMKEPKLVWDEQWAICSLMQDQFAITFRHCCWKSDGFFTFCLNSVLSTGAACEECGSLAVRCSKLRSPRGKSHIEENLHFLWQSENSISLLMGVWDFPALQVQGKSREITQMKVKNHIEQGYKTPSSLSITSSLLSAFFI